MQPVKIWTLLARTAFLFLPFVGWGQDSVQALPNAHAHNDYEHARPLLDALDQGFTSVEADVYLVDGVFFVYHDFPAAPDQGRTLDRLYLDPLSRRVRENQGRVYPGYEGVFYLMIDFKSEGAAAYKQLKELLLRYEEMLSMPGEQEESSTKPVRIFLSGNRPYDQILRDKGKIVALDGRPGELGRGIPAAVMPVVSDNYYNVLKWRGQGPVDPEQLQRLQNLVRQAHEEGKKVRLWAAPDIPPVWDFLLGQGVDLISSDRLPELREFLVQRSR